MSINPCRSKPVQNRIFTADPRERGEKVFYLAERYRQIKRFVILKKDKAHDSTTAIKRIDSDPEGTKFLLQSPSPD